MPSETSKPKDRVPNDLQNLRPASGSASLTTEASTRARENRQDARKMSAHLQAARKPSRRHVTLDMKVQAFRELARRQQGCARLSGAAE